MSFFLRKRWMIRSIFLRKSDQVVKVFFGKNSKYSIENLIEILIENLI